MNIIQPRLHLTTSERAILSLFFTALLTGGYTAIDAISNPGNIDWYTVIVVAIATALVAFFHTLATYLSTNGYLPLGAIVEAGTSAVEKRLQSTPTTGGSVPVRQFVLPPGPLTTRAEPIVLPVQSEPPNIQTSAPPPSSPVLEGTTLVPIITPVVPPPPQSID